MSAVLCLLIMALSSDTRLSCMPSELSRGDSELALGESGRGSLKLWALPKVLPKKNPFLDGLIVKPALELLLARGDLGDRLPAARLIKMTSAQGHMSAFTYG